MVLFLLHGILKQFFQGVVYFFLRCAPGYTGNPQLGQSCTPGSGNGGKTGIDDVLYKNILNYNKIIRKIIQHSNVTNFTKLNVTKTKCL